MAHILKVTASKNNADLYKKINDPAIKTKEVDELRKLLKNPLIFKNEHGIKLNQSLIVKKTIEQTDLVKSQPDKTAFLLLDNGLNLKEVKRFDMNRVSAQEVNRELLKESGVSYIITALTCSQKEAFIQKFPALDVTMDGLGKRFLDHILYDNERTISVEERGLYMQHLAIGAYRPELESKLTPSGFIKQDTILNIDGVQDFLDYVSQKEIKGLNLINDAEEINRLLQHRLNHLTIEKAIIIMADEDGNVIASPEIAKGMENQATIYPTHIYEELQSNDQAKYFVLAHNHPSGIIEFSNADIQLTEQLDKTMLNLGYGMVDHLLVPKNEPVQSFSLVYSMPLKTELEEQLTKQQEMTY